MTFEARELSLEGVVMTTSYKADSKEDVINMIRNKGFTPISIKREEEVRNNTSGLTLFKPKVKLKDLAVFCKQLSTMLYAGMPLIESLDVIKNQSENKLLKQISGDMVSQVQKGEILSTAMKTHANVFPDILIGMIEAGELTGKLDEVLLKMSDHYTKENKINQKIKSAMVYPAFIGVLAIVAVVFLLTFVMPTFIGMFSNTGIELPIITRILLAISDFIRSFWYILIMTIIIIVYAFKRYKQTDIGKLSIDRTLIKLPLIRKPVAQIATSRFTRTLSTLLSSGIPILRALESAAKVTNNKIVINGIDNVADDIKKGINLSTLLQRIKLFPPMMISMIKIGEESGALEEMLEKSADFYDEELEVAIQRLTSLIEPVMILLMALMVGFIVVAMMFPMFTMFQTIQ